MKLNYLECAAPLIALTSYPILMIIVIFSLIIRDLKVRHLLIFIAINYKLIIDKT